MFVDKEFIKHRWFSEIQSENNRDYFLYIDNPFCLNFCNFCIYSPTLINDKVGMDLKKEYYNKILVEEIDFYWDVLSKISIKAVYFWGGTSSVMSTEDMNRIFSQLQKYFDFKNIPIEKTFEFNPILMTFDKIDILKDWNFTNVTMWIQSFHQEVLNFNNRKNISIEKLLSLIEYLKQKEFQINMDLMVFIYKDDIVFDLKNLKNDIKIVLELLKPTRLTIFPNYHKIFDRDRSYSGDIFQKLIKINFLKISLLRTLLSKINYSEYYKDFPENQVTLENSKLNYYYLKKWGYKEIVYNSSWWTKEHSYLLKNNNVIAIWGHESRKPYSYIGDEFCYFNVYKDWKVNFELFFDKNL